jgi:hypothetical protein
MSPLFNALVSPKVRYIAQDWELGFLVPLFRVPTYVSG